MFQLIMGMLNNTTLLLFGVSVSAAFLSIPFNKKNIVVLLSFCMGVNGVHILLYVTIGYQATLWFYPIITHLPSVLLFSLYYKRFVFSSIFAVTSAFLCCQLSKWLSILVFEFNGNLGLSYGIRGVMNVILGFIIIRYIASSIAVILTKPLKTILIFCILPGVYYIFDYTATIYTNLLYSGSQVIFEFLPFVFCISYLIFNVVYFKQYEEKCEAENHNKFMELQRLQSQKEIENFKRSEYDISLLRHDMRHFLNNISSYIENNETNKAILYIREVIASVDKTVMKKYSENEIVNIILSSYDNRILELGIAFNYSIQIPTKLPFSDVDLTSILSNALENAIIAVTGLSPDNRVITLDLHMWNDKLLMSIKNPYSEPIKIVDGIPQSRETGHGLGTHSIKYVTEKLNGNCQFIAENGEFILRVIL